MKNVNYYNWDFYGHDPMIDVFIRYNRNMNIECYDILSDLLDVKDFSYCMCGFYSQKAMEEFYDELELDLMP